MTTNRNSELFRNAVKQEMQRILFDDKGEKINLYKIIHDLRHAHQEFDEDDIDWNKLPEMLMEISEKLRMSFLATSRQSVDN